MKSSGGESWDQGKFISTCHVGFFLAGVPSNLVIKVSRIHQDSAKRVILLKRKAKVHLDKVDDIICHLAFVMLYSFQGHHNRKWPRIFTLYSLVQRFVHTFDAVWSQIYFIPHQKCIQIAAPNCSHESNVKSQSNYRVYKPKRHL